MVVASPPTVRLLEAMLAPTGVRVTGVDDGREAVLSQRRDPADLILMGIHLRRMDGLEATRQIRATDQDVPIVAISRMGPSYTAAIAAAGIDDYLDKPLELDALHGVYGTLSRHLGRGRIRPQR